jgi:hypothetical protein
MISIFKGDLCISRKNIKARCFESLNMTRAGVFGCHPELVEGFRGYAKLSFKEGLG